MARPRTALPHHALASGAHGACVGLLVVLLAACQPADRRPSGRVYPLPRHQPGDGLAIVTRPRGEGLQIWLDPDTSKPGICTPRWNPDAARLRGGDGPRPQATGRAPRTEFYRAMASARVRWQLRQQFAILCQRRAPHRRFIWTEPPRRPADFRPPPLLMLEEQHLLSDPRAVRRAEKRLLGQPLGPEDLLEGELPPSGSAP